MEDAKTIAKDLSICGNELTCKDCSFAENGCIDQLLLHASTAINELVKKNEQIEDTIEALRSSIDALKCTFANLNSKEIERDLNCLYMQAVRPYYKVKKEQKKEKQNGKRNKTK